MAAEKDSAEGRVRDLASRVVTLEDEKGELEVRVGEGTGKQQEGEAATSQSHSAPHTAPRHWTRTG